MKKYIGFFDSGVGGLTVLKEVLKKDPSLNIVYFGDNKNAPYGQKSHAEIIEITKKAFQFLKEKNCDKIVIACNSVSAVVTKELAEDAGFERENIIEMSESTIKNCAEKNMKNILIISTEATKNSGLYAKQFEKENIKIESLSVNGLVDLIENNSTDLEKEKVIERELKKDKNIFSKIQNGEFENVILACTHFPLVENIFQKVFSERPRTVPNFINPAIFVSDEVSQKFSTTSDIVEKTGERKFYFSKDSEVTEKFVKEILG